MTKSKNTKRALLMSILSMMLCCAMLIGSTFAWFTDSVTSGMNKIVAGNLDVVLDYKPAIVDEETGEVTYGDWTPVPADGSLFKSADETLWEPGHTEFVYLRIRNAGTLALNYQFDVNVYGDAEGTKAEAKYPNVLGGEFKLSDYLVFSRIEGAAAIADRESLWIKDSEKEAEAMGDLSGLGKNSPKLLPGNAEEFTLAVYMPTQVGNEANYRGENAPEIYLGLSVFATQTPHEEDSFGNDYDAGLSADKNGVKKVLDDGTVLYNLEGGEVLLYDTQDVSLGEDGVYNVPAGVTAIDGYCFYHNSDIKEIVLPSSVKTLYNNAFRGTSAESIVLNEGLTAISASAFRDAANLEYIEIPSTVTTIGKEAFRLSGVVALTIPATVTTIEEGAFRDTPNLEDLYIEGNPTIANYAGRTCANLKTVTLEGDDVTFTGTSQVFTHADTGDANGITIYVVNDTVKERLIAAQANARGYTVEVVDIGSVDDPFGDGFDDEDFDFGD